MITVITQKKETARRPSRVNLPVVHNAADLVPSEPFSSLRYYYYLIKAVVLWLGRGIYTFLTRFRKGFESKGLSVRNCTFSGFVLISQFKREVKG